MRNYLIPHFLYQGAPANSPEIHQFILKRKKEEEKEEEEKKKTHFEIVHVSAVLGEMYP